MFDEPHFSVYHKYMGLTGDTQHIEKEANSLESLRFLARLISRRHIALSSAPEIQRVKQNGSDQALKKSRKVRRVGRDPKIDPANISLQDSGT